MAHSYCTDCGAQLAPESKFCGSCGTIVVAGPRETAPEIALVRPDAEEPQPPSAEPVPSETSTPAAAPGRSSATKISIIVGAAGAVILLIVLLVNPFAGTSTKTVSENDLPFMTAETNGLGACAQIPSRGGPNGGAIAGIENGEWGATYSDSFAAGRADSFIQVRLPAAAVLRSLPSQRWGRDAFRCAQDFTLIGRWVVGHNGTRWLKVGYDGYIAQNLVQELGPVSADQPTVVSAGPPVRQVPARPPRHDRRRRRRLPSRGNF